jgi:hypothetical protein
VLNNYIQQGLPTRFGVIPTVFNFIKDNVHYANKSESEILRRIMSIFLRKIQQETIWCQPAHSLIRARGVCVCVCVRERERERERERFIYGISTSSLTER